MYVWIVEEVFDDMVGIRFIVGVFRTKKLAIQYIKKVEKNEYKRKNNYTYRKHKVNDL